MIIATSQLTKRYGNQLALDDLALEIGEGEVFGYLGPNGAGKTTTIRLLLGFLSPTAGSARVFGRDAWRDSVSIHRRVGYVPGEVRLYDYLTGAELLRLLSRLRRVECSAQWEELAQRLQLDLGKRIRAYSRGMKQKLGLIQALMHQPQLIILDESTTGLDPLMQQELYEILRERKQDGATVFFSSHNLSEVEKLCDRVGIVRGGKLVALESVADLQQRKVRRVEVVFADGVGGAAVELPNATLTAQRGRHFVFTVRGSIDSFVKSLAQLAVEELTIEPPGLEERFFEFYRDDA